MPNNNYPVRAFATDNTVTFQFDHGVTKADLQNLASLFKEMMDSKFEMVAAQMDDNSNKIDSLGKETKESFNNVKQIIKSKSISPEDLAALETLVKKKAEQIIEKSDGIQIDMSVFEGVKSDQTISLQKLLRKEIGKVKHRIWIDLNKNCLGRKGTAPKNRIRDIDVQRAFDFVRCWGGITI